MEDDIAYTIRVSTRARRLAIYVDMNGHVKVVRPMHVSQARAHAFVNERIWWVIRTVARQKLRAGKRRSIRWEEGGALSFLGKRLTLRVTEGNTKIRVFRHGDTLHVCVQHTSSTSIRFAVEQWYRMQARRFFHVEVNRVTEQLHVRYGRIAVKDQRTVWGSCSKKGNLNFSWRLLMAPREVAEYIVVHESAHLVHLNHSKKYWALVELLMPDYKRYERWLKEQGRSLR